MLLATDFMCEAFGRATALANYLLDPSNALGHSSELQFLSKVWIPRKGPKTFGGSCDVSVYNRFMYRFVYFFVQRPCAEISLNYLR